MQTLKARADFLRLRNGQKWAAPGLVLQMCAAPDSLRATLEAQGVLRVGYTATKAIGGAVQRNRAKRRLRAAAAEVLPRQGRPGHDYVLIGRTTTLVRPFSALTADLAAAVSKVHDGERARRRPAGDAR